MKYLVFLCMVTACTAQMNPERMMEFTMGLMADCDPKVCLCPKSTFMACFAENMEFVDHAKMAMEKCGITMEDCEQMATAEDMPKDEVFNGMGCMLHEFGWINPDTCTLNKDQIQECMGMAPASNFLCCGALDMCFELGAKVPWPMREFLDLLNNHEDEENMMAIMAAPVIEDGPEFQCPEMVDFDDITPDEMWGYGRNAVTLKCLKYVYSKACSVKVSAETQTKMHCDMKMQEMQDMMQQA